MNRKRDNTNNHDIKNASDEHQKRNNRNKVEWQVDVNSAYMDGVLKTVELIVDSGKFQLSRFEIGTQLH